MADEWTNAELMRAVVSLTEAVKELRAEIGRLGSEFVSKEVFGLHNTDLDRRLDIIGEEQVNLAADLARHHKEHGSAWEKWIPPVATGVIVAIIAGVITVLTTAHH